MRDDGVDSDDPPPDGGEILQALDFLFETGYLKRLPRAGWLLAGVQRPESVAEHTFRTAVIGFVLAIAEGANALRTTALCLFHDVTETRVTDLHPVARSYLGGREAERKAAMDATKGVGGSLSRELQGIFGEIEKRVSQESIIARDADLLECIIQAHEYKSYGVMSVADFLNVDGNLFRQLSTKSARDLARAAINSDPNKWWNSIISEKQREE